MSNSIKLGVLGCASIAERYLIPAINESNSFELFGVASRSAPKAGKFAKQFETQAYYGYEELISSDIEAVYIPLPNSMHYEWIKKAIERGLHVLVEKSMACSFSEVVELNRLAKLNNVALVENFQFRFHSQLQYIKKLVADNHIGSLRNIRSSFGFPPFADEDNIRYQKDLGGGALLDAGAYPLKITQMFLGQDIYVDSASLHTPKDREVEIWGSAFIKQKDGDLTSQIAFGFDHFYQNTIELWGSKGKITASRIFTAAPGFEPTIQVETDDGSKTIQLAEDNHFRNMLSHFYCLVTSKQGLDNEYQQNVIQARLINELNEKANAK